MKALILSIVFSSSLYVIFKLFSIFKVNTLQAIVVNYIVAAICGFLFYKSPISVQFLPEKPWFYGALILGVLFITVFNFMALTSQQNGLSVAAVASKMSVVIPVMFAVIIYKETLSVLNGLGILIALLAVYFTTVKTNKMKISTSTLLFPLLLFFGSGIIDTAIKYYEITHLTPSEIPLFSGTIFSFAAIFGFLLISIKKQWPFKLKNIIAGICLGVPNYFSILFIIKALQNKALGSSIIFTINNVSIVMLSTLLGILIFKEHISRKNWLGIALSVISIVFLTLD